MFNPLHHTRAPFNTFENRVDPNQAALVRAAWSGSIPVYSVCLWKYDPRPTLVDLTSNFFVLCANKKVIYIINRSGW